MDKLDLEKAYIATHLINTYPSFIRSEILKDSSFCREIGIGADAVITFGNSICSFSRTKLYTSIREAFASKDQCSEIKDENDELWVVSIEGTTSCSIKIKNHSEEFNNDGFWPLNPNVEQRTLQFNDIAITRHLAKQDIDNWNSLLLNELSNEDATRLIADLECTPSYLEELLKFEAQEERSKFDTLVPNNAKYYERFVGVHENSENIVEYSSNELQKHLGGKTVSHFELLICANVSISKALSLNISDESQFVSLIEKSISWNNPFMLIGCLEIGLSNYSVTLKDQIYRIFQCLLSDETKEQLKLLSSLFVFVDGELSRLGIFKNKPPFYRRLAAFSQASLISKVSVEEAVRFKDMEKWAMDQRGLIFFSQSFIDLRLEPRWLPGYISSNQLQDEILGRINGALNNTSERDFAKTIHQELTKDKPLPFSAFFSGPLEGNIEPNEIPDDVRKTLEDKMGGEASLDTFTALINLTHICKVDSKYAELAASLLENTQHQLEGNVDKEAIYHALNGLATVSATLRSKKLAASVMILARVYREYLNVNNAPENILAIGIVAAAAYSNKDEWAEYIGQWAFEIANIHLEKNSKNSLASMINELCVLEPYLYYTCSRTLEILDA